jgi:hypothetical protein
MVVFAKTMHSHKLAKKVRVTIFWKVRESRGIQKLLESQGILV